MKIITKDNFNRNRVREKVIAKEVSKQYGRKIVRMLNEDREEFSSYRYVLVEDD